MLPGANGFRCGVAYDLRVTTRPIKAKLVDLALEHLGQARPGDLLAFVSRQRLAREANCAPGTVNYNFGGQGQAFDPDLLASSAYTVVVDELIELSKRSAVRYETAIGGLEDDRSAATLLRALAGNLVEFETYDDPATNGRERLYFMGAAIADTSGAFRRETQRLDEAVTEVYAPIYDGICAALGRRWATGDALRATGQTIAMYLDGVTLRRRAGIDIPNDRVADAVGRIFQAYTVRIGDSDPDPPYVEMLRDGS